MRKNVFCNKNIANREYEEYPAVCTMMTDPEPDDVNDNLQFLRNICLKEHSKLVANLPQLAQKIWQFTARASNNGAAHEIVSECLTNTAYLLRKMNLHMSLVGTELSMMTATTTGRQSIVAERPPPPVDVPNAPPAVPKRSDDPKVASCVPKYGNPKYDLQRYTPNYSGVAIVSHVPEAADNNNIVAVYLVDSDSPHASVISALSPDNCQPLCCIESIHEQRIAFPSDGLFGVQLEGNIFRALRAASKTSAHQFAVHLVDTGELVDLAPDAMLYSLMLEHREVPALALPCRTTTTPYGTAVQQAAELRAFLERHLYQRVRFHVIEKVTDENVLEVSVHKLQASTNPFLDPVDAVVPPAHETAEIFGTIKSPTPAATAMPAEPPTPAEQQPPLACSREERAWANAQLDAIDPHDRFVDGTSNAMIAVTGYDPRDDARICPHYNVATGGCFKGGQCRLEHSAKLPDGWTRDQRPSVVRERIPQAWPACGTLIKCVPTHIVHVDTFYGQIVPCSSAQELQLTELTRRMNAVEVVAAMRPFAPHRPPDAQELVLVRFEDRMWHRARVLEVGEVAIRVFFVDYGNRFMVELKDVRQWDGRFEYLPFQAYEFRLVDVRRRQEKLITADLLAVRDLVLHRQMLAHVKTNKNVLAVVMSNENGLDISAALLAMGLVVPVQVPIFGKDQPYPV